VHYPRGEVAAQAVAGAVHRQGRHPDEGRRGRGNSGAVRPPEKAALLGVEVRNEGAQLVVDFLRSTGKHKISKARVRRGWRGLGLRTRRLAYVKPLGTF